MVLGWELQISLYSVATIGCHYGVGGLFYILKGKEIMKKVNILGTEYTIEIQSKEENEYLKKCDGYCDKTSHKIVVVAESTDNELEFFGEYQRKCIRHEIIHAFMFESGLAENFEHANQFGHEETMVDWIAIQFPKMLKVFKEAECV